jgi:chemotaxis protein methyltransferase CheR
MDDHTINDEALEKVEIELFVEAIYRRYGYDFRHYAKASVQRRARHILAQSEYERMSELIPRIMHDPEFARQAIYTFSITVTEMFRDPEFYRAVREQIIPYLKTYPFIKVWVAGCATGEEVYSLAIMLMEEGLYDRVTLFGTDFNDMALDKAREGIYPLKNVQQYTTNYQRAGGARSFGDYYHAEYESAIMDPSLKANITFANHNLTTDGVFSEMHLIFCRNVLIYFNLELQNRVLDLLSDSLTHGGFLCLGTRETLDFREVKTSFQAIDAAKKVYQKRVATREVLIHVD